MGLLSLALAISSRGFFVGLTLLSFGISLFKSSLSTLVMGCARRDEVCGHYTLANAHTHTRTRPTHTARSSSSRPYVSSHIRPLVFTPRPLGSSLLAPMPSYTTEFARRVRAWSRGRLAPSPARWT